MKTSARQVYNLAVCFRSVVLACSAVAFPSTNIGKQPVQVSQPSRLILIWNQNFEMEIINWRFQSDQAELLRAGGSFTSHRTPPGAAVELTFQKSK